MNEKNKMLSLYDYLKKPAGAVLGKQVYEQAKKDNIKVQTRIVDARTYKGQIILYPKEFLDNYFNNVK
jgi:hypothetical protein